MDKYILACDKLGTLLKSHGTYGSFKIEKSIDKSIAFNFSRGGKIVGRVAVIVDGTWTSNENDTITEIPEIYKSIWLTNPPCMLVVFNSSMESNKLIQSATIKKRIQVGDGILPVDCDFNSLGELAVTEETNIPMYTHVYHNNRDDKMYVWYADGSCQDYNTSHRFYTPNKGQYGSIPCGMSDIFGNPMYVAHTDHLGEKELKDAHYGPNNTLSEIDVEYRTRWLQERYKSQSDIKFTASDFNVCFLDIEVESGVGFPSADVAEYPVNAVTTYYSRQDSYVAFGLGNDIPKESRNRLETLNQYKFGTGLLFSDGTDNIKLLTEMRSNELINKFDIPSGDDIGEFDIVKVLNGILNSSTTRDDFFRECVSDKYDLSWNDELKNYLPKFASHEETKKSLNSKITDRRNVMFSVSAKERYPFRIEIADMLVKYNTWVSKQEAVLKEERLQKKLIRSVMEHYLPVVKGIYPKDSKFVYIKCQTEKELLTKLFRTISKADVDILSGWNCAGFDWPYLLNRSTQQGVNKNLLKRSAAQSIPGGVYIGKNPKQYKKTDYKELTIPGTTQYDYLLLYKMFSRNERDNYKLDTIARNELGDEKRPMSNGYHTYRTNWAEYLEYNVQDVKLLVDMDASLKLMETAVGVCSQARIPLDGLFESKKIIVGYMLTYLHNMNMVMPPLIEHPITTFPGAFVFSKPGLYKKLVSFDYRSMYPSIDMAANISIETKVKFPEGYMPTIDELKNLVISPVPGVYFRKDKTGIVPSVMKTLFDGRTDIKLEMKKAKKEGRFADAEFLDMKQNAYKIFGNSLYGLLGLRYFQFYDQECAHSITAFGMDLIKYTCARVSDYFDNLLVNDDRFVKAFGEKPTLDPSIKKYDRFSHGDTDSFFIIFDDLYKPFKDKYTLTEFCRIFDKCLFNELLADIMSDFSTKWNCKENTFYLKREKCILGALVVARKKYICSVESNEDYIYPEPTPAVTGLEIVRSSTAPFARTRLQTLAWEMVNGGDRLTCTNMYADAKKEFYDHVSSGDVFPISIPSGIGKTPADVARTMTEKGHTHLVKAGSLWNELIKNDEFLSTKMYEPIAGGSKIKYLHVSPRNKWRAKHVAYSGTDYPDRLGEIFDINWELQFEKVYGSTAGKLFEVAGWPKDPMKDNRDILDMF